ncbi:hypothetical protein ABMX48_12255 [Streptomyces cavourensis]
MANGSGADIRVGGVAIEALPVDRSPVRAGQDLKLEFDFTGDPDMTEGVMDRIAQDLKRIDSDYPVFSDWLAEQLDEHRVDEGDVTSKSGSGQLRFDARTAVSGKTVSFTVPGSDVYTSTSWWQGFLISAMSVALGLASAGVCLVSHRAWRPHAASSAGSSERSPTTLSPPWWTTNWTRRSGATSSDAPCSSGPSEPSAA